MRGPGLAVVIAVVVMLAGCAAASEEPPSTTSRRSAAPSASTTAPSSASGTVTFTATGSPTPAATGFPGLTGTIDFGRIGQLSTAMTLEQMRAALRSPAPLGGSNPACASAVFRGAQGAKGAADALVFAIAVRHGAHGAADVVGLGTSFGAETPGAAVLAELPRTADGLGLGSRLADVLAVYPKASVAPTKYGDGSQVVVEDGDGRAIDFIATPQSSMTVTTIVTGAADLVPGDDACG